MESQVADTLELLAREGLDNDARQSDHGRKFLNLDPQTASMVSTLFRGAKAGRILEIGTSTGYSTIWLAWSVRPLNGRVVTIDRSADKHAQARRNLRDAGLAEFVEFHCGDATDIVQSLEGSFDGILFDADRTSAPDQLRVLLPKLSPGALIMADNALSHPEEIASYLQMVRELPGITHTILPIGKGLSVACRGAGRRDAANQVSKQAGV